MTERSGTSVDKEFYVSPFFAVEGRYDIRTRLTDSQVAVAISLTQETPQGEETVFTATVHGGLRPATRGRVLRAARPQPAALPAGLRTDPLARRPPLAAPPARRPPPAAPGPERNELSMSTTFEPRIVATVRAAAGRSVVRRLRAQIARTVVKRILRDMPVTVRLPDGELYGAPVGESRPDARSSIRPRRSSRGSRTAR